MSLIAGDVDNSHCEHATQMQQFVQAFEIYSGSKILVACSFFAVHTFVRCGILLSGSNYRVVHINT